MLPISEADFARASREIQRNPKQAIKAAREGNSLQIKIIANNVQAIPQLQTPEVVEMLVSHLDASKCPDPTKPAAPRSPATVAADRAHGAIMALANFGPLLQTENAALLQPIKDGWRGIARWMAFFYTLNTNPHMGSPAQRKSSLEVIAYALYSFTQDDALQTMISATPGMISLTTKLWMQEDAGALPSLLPMPVCSAAFHHVLFVATDAMLDEVVQAAGGKASTVAELGLGRLRALLDKPQVDPKHVHAYVDALIAVSRSRKHPLRRAILGKGGVGLAAKALLRLSATRLDEENIPAVTTCFGFISNLIEAGDGIPYVRQAVQRGLLQAFVNVSPSFNRLDAEARRFTLRLIKDTIPRYLVYRSVIVAVDAAMRALETPEDRKKIDKSPVADSWYQTKKLAHERLLIKWRSDAMKREVAHCDYCRKKAPKDNLKRCTGCGTTLYCSKECQVSGWKKSHKAECKLKKEELRVLQDDAIRKEDRLFHHHLAIRDARHNMPRLHSIAARDFPGIPKANLGMSIDYTVVPPTYGVFALDKHDLSKDIKPGTSRVTEARSDSILEKAQMSGGKTTLIESKICVGEGCSIVMTLTAQSVWESAERWEEEEWRWHQNEGGDEDTMPTSVDEIDLMMARNAIRGFLQAHGKSTEGWE